MSLETGQPNTIKYGINLAAYMASDKLIPPIEDAHSESNKCLNSSSVGDGTENCVWNHHAIVKSSLMFQLRRTYCNLKVEHNLQ